MGATPFPFSVLVPYAPNFPLYFFPASCLVPFCFSAVFTCLSSSSVPFVRAVSTPPETPVDRRLAAALTRRGGPFPSPTTLFLQQPFVPPLIHIPVSLVSYQLLAISIAGGLHTAVKQKYMARTFRKRIKTENELKSHSFPPHPIISNKRRQLQSLHVQAHPLSIPSPRRRGVLCRPAITHNFSPHPVASCSSRHSATHNTKKEEY